MSGPMGTLFKKQVFQRKIQSRLPRLFQIAEIDRSPIEKLTNMKIQLKSPSFGKNRIFCMIHTQDGVHVGKIINNLNTVKNIFD